MCSSVRDSDQFRRDTNYELGLKGIRYGTVTPTPSTEHRALPCTLAQDNVRGQAEITARKKSGDKRRKKVNEVKDGDRESEIPKHSHAARSCQGMRVRDGRGGSICM